MASYPLNRTVIRAWIEAIWTSCAAVQPNRSIIHPRSFRRFSYNPVRIDRVANPTAWDPPG